MALTPKASLTLGNKCNKVTITDTTGIYDALYNTGGWGNPNLETIDVINAGISIVDYFNAATSNITAISTSGSISGTIFTDTTHGSGTFTVGQTLTGPGVLPGTKITSLMTGTGSNNGGTYQINFAQTVTGVTIQGANYDVTYDVTAGILAYTGTAETFTILSNASWTQPDGIYKIIYSVSDGTSTFTNTSQKELFLCNLCNCKDNLIMKLLDANSSLDVTRLKEQVNQMEIFIYGIEHAFECGDYGNAANILEAATTYCQTITGCSTC